MIRPLYVSTAAAPDGAPTDSANRLSDRYPPTTRPAMSEEFDPYRKWLGIPAKDQPANHYRLLGIPHFEDDPDVIDNAATRQIAHVRTFQSGKHAAQSQKILTELTQARLCLLQPEKKSAYDANLRAELAAAGRLSGEIPPPATVPPMAVPPVAVPPIVAPVLKPSDAAPPPPRVSSKPAVPPVVTTPVVTSPVVSTPAPPVTATSVPAATAPGASGIGRRRGTPPVIIPPPFDLPPAPPVAAVGPPPAAPVIAAMVAPSSKSEPVRKPAVRWRTDGEGPHDAEVAPVPIPMQAVAAPPIAAIDKPQETAPRPATSAPFPWPLMIAAGAGVVVLMFLGLIVLVVVGSALTKGPNVASSSDAPAAGASTTLASSSTPSSSPSTMNASNERRPERRPPTRPANAGDDTPTPFPIGSGVPAEESPATETSAAPSPLPELPRGDDSMRFATPEERIRSELFQARSAIGNRDNDHFRRHMAEANQLIDRHPSPPEELVKEAAHLRDAKNKLDTFWTAVRESAAKLPDGTMLRIRGERIEFLRREGSILFLKTQDGSQLEREVRDLDPATAIAIAFGGKKPETAEIRALSALFLLFDAKAIADSRATHIARQLFVSAFRLGLRDATAEAELATQGFRFDPENLPPPSPDFDDVDEQAVVN